MLVFCSNCGQELTGAKKFCSVCGYQLSNDEFREVSQTETYKMQSTQRQDKVKFTEVDNDNDDFDDENEKAENQRSTEIATRPSHDYVDKPPGTQVKEKIPKSINCTVCGVKTNDICFFCDWAVCKRHTVNMQIVTDTGRFGNVIQSCPNCADLKTGRQPMTEEAADVGFFFKIKPYHEWKIVH